MLYDYRGSEVQCLGTCYIAPSADLIGMVTLGDGANVWFQTVVRGDTDRIFIGENTNIQDGSILHTDEGIELVVERNVTVGHRAVLHGCRVCEGSLVGIGATILNGAVIGRECIIAAGTLIPEDKEIPAGSVVMGSPGQVVREVTERDRKVLRDAVRHYLDRARIYRESVRQLEGPAASSG